VHYTSPGFEALPGRAPEKFGDDPEAFLDLFHPEDRQAYADGMAALFSSRDTEGQEFELGFRRPDGELRWVEVAVYAVTEGDYVLRYVGLIEDITETKRRERDLQAKNERLDQFASLVSHDLRNPLQAAKTRLELAQETDEPEHLAHVDRNLDRMDRLVSDILTLARQGKSVTETERIALDTAANRAWASLDAPAATLVTDTEAAVAADDATVRVGRLPDDTGFYVEDDGPGVPPEDRESVFDMGYSTRREGTGFGLPIVREIADAHGWFAAVTDGPTDGADGTGGARFVFTNVEF
jgi:PAS domain S-box-containing protein